MWEKVSSRHHKPLKIFPYGSNADEVMLYGTVDYGLKDGKSAAVEWAGHAHLVKDGGVVKMDFYQVYLVSLYSLLQSSIRPFFDSTYPRKMLRTLNWAKRSVQFEQFSFPQYTLQKLAIGLLHSPSTVTFQIGPSRPRRGFVRLEGLQTGDRMCSSILVQCILGLLIMLVGAFPLLNCPRLVTQWTDRASK